jgi:hypothetical protein
MTRSPVRDTAELTRGQAIISGFAVFQILAIVCWGLPINSLLVTRFRDSTAPLVRTIGLAQTWPMFAPNPQVIAVYLQAEIMHRGGRTTIWKFPIPSDYGAFEQYSKGRHLQWGTEAIRLDAAAPLWPDAARFIARAHDDPRDPPTGVTLVRYWAAMPPPTFARVAPPLTWHREAFFTYAIQPGDLP